MAIGIYVEAVRDKGCIFHYKRFTAGQKVRACLHARAFQKKHPEANSVRVQWEDGHPIFWPEVVDKHENPEKYMYAS